MVNVIIDYKKTAQKSKCLICCNLIKKGQRRIRVETNNYFRECNNYHLSCFLEKCHSFVDMIPINELKI